MTTPDPAADERGRVVADLARAKAIFQQRAILSAMGVNPDRAARVRTTTDDR